MVACASVTLGAGDVATVIRYYEAVDWRRSSLSVDNTISFLRDGTVVLGLFDRDDLAADCTADGCAPVA